MLPSPHTPTSGVRETLEKVWLKGLGSHPHQPLLIGQKLYSRDGRPKILGLNCWWAQVEKIRGHHHQCCLPTPASTCREGVSLQEKQATVPAPSS